MIFYFSGTGNSKWVAEYIANKLHDRCVFVGEGYCAQENWSLEDGERLGFVFPVYAWGIPEFFESFIRSLKIQNVQYVYFVCTCGDDTGLTKESFIRLGEMKGWKVDMGYSVRMPNTYVCLPGFDVDPDEMMKRKKSDAIIRVDDIVKNLIVYKTSFFDVYPGSMAWIKSKVIRPLFNKILVSPKPFHVLNNCVGCGICSKQCPMQNIVMNPRPKWGNNCVGCLRCYHSCPTNAIQFGVFTKGKGQYLYKK
ncbi:MAG: EFR1 family ferrodoxin [Bacteroidaceae bacterium]|nr:EFR1 family ferrodoxin [Bacteroidaceae bacterium]